MAFSPTPRCITRRITRSAHFISPGLRFRMSRLSTTAWSFSSCAWDSLSSKPLNSLSVSWLVPLGFPQCLTKRQSCAMQTRSPACFEDAPCLQLRSFLASPETPEVRPQASISALASLCSFMLYI